MPVDSCIRERNFDRKCFASKVRRSRRRDRDLEMGVVCEQRCGWRRSCAVEKRRHVVLGVCDTRGLQPLVWDRLAVYAVGELYAIYIKSLSVIGECVEGVHLKFMSQSQNS